MATDFLWLEWGSLAKVMKFWQLTSGQAPRVCKHPGTGSFGSTAQVPRKIWLYHFQLWICLWQKRHILETNCNDCLFTSNWSVLNVVLARRTFDGVIIVFIILLITLVIITITSHNYSRLENIIHNELASRLRRSARLWCRGQFFPSYIHTEYTPPLCIHQHHQNYFHII